MMKRKNSEVWKPELYKIQLEAPQPIVVPPENEVENVPHFYGREYHGEISHIKVHILLNKKCDGSYLVRRSPLAKDFFTLSLRFNNKTKHFKIYYKPNVGHFVQQQQNSKCFETVHDLVADGLVNFYMEIHAAPILLKMMLQTKDCYQRSPYMTLNKKKLLALSNDITKSRKDENHIEPIVLNPSTIEDSSTNILPIIYRKKHTFKVHTFKGLNWCEFCANFLWGFTAQGVKCEDCGFIAHSKCSELVPAKCVPDLKRIRGVFGIDLTTLVAAHQCTIPFVIKRCIEEIENRGMLQEGIYRVSGFADEIDALKLSLDRDGEKADISEAVYSNINVIAGTLKLYLRLLPVPLITFQAYPAFMVAARCKTIPEQIQAVKEALKQLPPAHFRCLKFLIEHLNRVASHYEQNKMNEHNLATVFAPTLIATPRHMTVLSQEIYMLSNLIAHCYSVFNKG